MIDLDKIERQCKGAIENGYGHLPVLECGNAVKLMEVISRIRYAESETDAILSMLRHSEKDAARYRFMRDMSDEVDVSRFFHVEINERDAEIDEAMQCNK